MKKIVFLFTVLTTVPIYVSAMDGKRAQEM